MSNSRSEPFYENAPCGLVSTDLNGSIIRANRTFAQWCGRPVASLEGTDFRSLLSTGSAIFHETHFLPLLRMQGHVSEIASELRSADDTTTQTLINGAIESDENGTPQLIHFSIFKATHRRQYEEDLLAAKVRAEESEARARALAETLQASLIPPAPPSVPGLDVGAAYRPAGRGDEVGGDFYDVFEVANGDWMVVLGDVCGKGAAAAAVTALARHTLRAGAITTASPASMLALLSAALLRQSSDRFCTAVCAMFSISSEGATVRIALGGHPFPLHVKPDGTIDHVGTRGDVLGVIDTPSFHDQTIELNKDESLVFYTDGITEARRDGTFFGEDGLRSVLINNTEAAPQELSETIATQVVDFQRGMPRDDVAIVVVQTPHV